MATHKHASETTSGKHAAVHGEGVVKEAPKEGLDPAFWEVSPYGQCLTLRFFNVNTANDQHGHVAPQCTFTPDEAAALEQARLAYQPPAGLT